MNLLFQNKQQSRPPSFFSTNLSPKNRTEINGFQTQIDNDSIYYMAEEVKRKISKSSRKQMKKEPIMHLSFVQKDKKQSDTNFQSSPSPHNKTVCTSKSLNPRMQRAFNISNTIQDQRRLLSRITIHRIRSQRQQLQKETKRISNNYNYVFQRIEKDKKKSIETKMKQQKSKEIHQSSRRIKDQLQHERNIFLEQKSMQKSRLRETVLKQKKNKERSLANFYNNLHKNASQIRFQSQKIDQEILKTQMNQIEKNKIKYLTEKQKQKQRLLTRQKSFEHRILQGQTQFKQKWLREFNQTSKARKIFLTKKQMLNKKMQKMYEELRKKQNPFFESGTKMDDWANPQQVNFHYEK